MPIKLPDPMIYIIGDPYAQVSPRELRARTFDRIREESARAAARIREEKAMAAKFDPSSVRIVCMKCPAVATIHFIEIEEIADCLIVLASCHERRILARIDSEFIAKLNGQGDTTVAFEWLRPIDNIQERRDETEVEMLRLANRLAMYDRYLAGR
jgi:hypothetical protein